MDKERLKKNLVIILSIAFGFISIVSTLHYLATTAQIINDISTLISLVFGSLMMIGGGLYGLRENIEYIIKKKEDKSIK